MLKQGLRNPLGKIEAKMPTTIAALNQVASRREFFLFAGPNGERLVLRSYSISRPMPSDGRIR